jgi:hypothetical protein
VCLYVQVGPNRQTSVRMRRLFDRGFPIRREDEDVLQSIWQADTDRSAQMDIL